MPFKKSYKKTRSQKKPSLKAAKKVIGKYHKSQKAKSMDTYPLTCKFTMTSIPTQGATVSNYVYHSFPLMNPSSTTDVTQNAEFSLFKNIYDQVRINSILIKVTPKANVLSQAEAQYDGVMTLTGDGLVHTVVDRNSAGPWNVSALTKYSSYRKFNQKKAFSRSYKVSWPKGVWLDCKSIYDDQTLLKRLGCFGGLTLYAENLPEDANEVINEPWADIHIYYNVVFRGKTSASLSSTDGGGVKVDPIMLGAPPDFSRLVVTSGGFVNERLVSTDEGGIVTDLVDDNAIP